MKLLFNILLVCYLYLSCYFDLGAAWIAGGIVVYLLGTRIFVTKKRIV